MPVAKVGAPRASMKGASKPNGKPGASRVQKSNMATARTSDIFTGTKRGREGNLSSSGNAVRSNLRKRR